MTQEEVALAERRLTTPRAAAVAGILFAVLFTTGLVLMRLIIPADPSASGAWLERGADRVKLALGLMPFAGIAFLWFMGDEPDRQYLCAPDGGCLHDLVGHDLAPDGSDASLAVLTYLLALTLLLIVNFSLWVQLIFPGWVFAISVHILFVNLRRQKPDATKEVIN